MSKDVTGCRFCENNGEDEQLYLSHNLKTVGLVTCPILRAYVCPVCQATGGIAHTIKYCPTNKDGAFDRGRSIAELMKMRKASGGVRKKVSVLKEQSNPMEKVGGSRGKEDGRGQELKQKVCCWRNRDAEEDFKEGRRNKQNKERDETAGDKKAGDEETADGRIEDGQCGNEQHRY